MAVAIGEVLEYLRTRSWNNFILEEFIEVHCFEHHDEPEVLNAALQGPQELYQFLYEKMRKFLDQPCVEQEVVIWPELVD